MRDKENRRNSIFIKSISLSFANYSGSSDTAAIQITVPERMSFILNLYILLSQAINILRTCKTLLSTIFTDR